MKQWQSAPYFMALLMMTYATTNTSGIKIFGLGHGTNLTPDQQPMKLSLSPFSGRYESRLNANITSDIKLHDSALRSRGVVSSTLRTMLIPAYVRLRSTNTSVTDASQTQGDLKLIKKMTKDQDSFEKHTTKFTDIMIEAHSNANIKYTTSSEIPRIKASDTQIEKYTGMTEVIHPVEHAAVPQGLKAYPLPLKNADHELQLNVTWLPSIGPPVADYSLEIRSITDAADCKTPMCYEYNIPGDSLWWPVPPYTSTIAESCAIKPGCAYTVRLIAHPWDGHTSANLNIELDECVAGVCSCAHSPRLPTPRVFARAVSVHGELFVNVTWETPAPAFPNRLPQDLKKQYYFVSIGKQMVSDAHPSPWFAQVVSRRVDTDTPVAVPDGPRWTLLSTVERSGQRSDVRPRNIMLDVKLLARVTLIDERGCVGRTGNATAYDPVEAKKKSITTYAVWAIFGGACVLAMITIFAVSARVIKRVLNAFRPATSSAALEPLRNRPLRFPLSVNA